MLNSYPQELSTGIKNVGAAKTIAERFGYDLSNYNLPDKRKALRNAVNPIMGQLILNAVTGATYADV